MLGWDEAKSRWNLRERGFSFEYAARIFAGDTVERDGTRHDHGKGFVAGGPDVAPTSRPSRRPNRRATRSRPSHPGGSARRC